MAARLRPHHQEDIKAKIQTVKLVQLLQDDATGKLKSELTVGRRDSAKFLVNKTMGNPTQEIDQKVTATVEVTQRPQLTKEEWLKAHGLGTAGGATG